MREMEDFDVELEEEHSDKLSTEELHQLWLSNRIVAEELSEEEEYKN